MENNNSSNLVEIKSVDKWFGELQALDNVSLDVPAGKVMVIIGPSGSGKSTLLRCINYLETPTNGQVWFNGEKMSGDQKELNRHRAEIGMVFQSFNLYAHLTILQNITLALKVVKKLDEKEAETLAMEQLKRVGIADKADKMPAQISGGQQQRAAIARALVNNPRIVFADEPTGNLDSHTGDAILHLFRQLSQEGRTIVLVTHDPEIAAVTPRRIEIRDGKIATKVDLTLAGLARPGQPAGATAPAQS